MLNQKTDLEVICRQVLMLQLQMLQLQIVDSIKAERRQNVIQDYRLTDNDNGISNLEKQNEEILRTLAKFDKKLSIYETQLQEFQDSVQLLEAEIPYLRHLVCRNEELQNERDFFYPPD
ncbi:hypothetical protein NUACC21_37600 [Scytonema sp. NUACC21]